MGDYGEQRRGKREQSIYYLQVTDRGGSRTLGRLVDLTTEGMMLVSEEPLVPENNYGLQITLPREIAGATEVEFEAQCRWCRQAANPDYFDVGLQVLDISVSHLSRLELLIKYFSFSG